MVAPLLQFAPDGLWQIIRIFTGFYNIPIIAIVIVGLFTRHVPALGPKLVIGFHLIAYGLLQFVFKEQVAIHFLHLYAILFFIEIGIMLSVGYWLPRVELWTYTTASRVDMSPWPLAVPRAVTLFSCVVALYITFSPLGLVGAGSAAYEPILGLVFALNAAVWWRSLRSA